MVPYVSIVEIFLAEHSLTDSASSKPSQPKKKKLVKDVSDMTEEEQLQAAMLASIGASATSTDIPPSFEDEVPTSAPEGNNHYPLCDLE